MLASVALFFSLAQVWPLKARDTAQHERAVYSRVISRAGQGAAVGLEILPQKPFLRLIRASTIPIEMPMAAGAFIAMVGSPATTGAADPAADDKAAPDASGSCQSCHYSSAPCCSINYNGGCCQSCHPQCWTVVCTGTDQFRTGGYTCVTCGHATCPVCI